MPQDGVIKRREMEGWKNLFLEKLSNGIETITLCASKEINKVKNIKKGRLLSQIKN